MHVLQPKHSKLKQEEIKKLLEKYNISLSQLPKIKFNDPILNSEFEIGEVVKIERKSKASHQTEEYFRAVIA